MKLEILLTGLIFVLICLLGKPCAYETDIKNEPYGFAVLKEELRQFTIPKLNFFDPIALCIYLFRRCFEAFFGCPETTTTAALCPDNSKEINGNCYSLSTDEQDLTGAQGACDDQGGFLALVEPTNAAITTLLGSLMATCPTEYTTIFNDPRASFIRVAGVEDGLDGDFTYTLADGTMVSLNMAANGDVLTRTVADEQEALSLTPQGRIADTIDKFSAIGNTYSTYYLCQFDKV